MGTSDIAALPSQRINGFGIGYRGRAVEFILNRDDVLDLGTVFGFLGADGIRAQIVKRKPAGPTVRR